MVTRGTWSPVKDRSEWTGRRDAGRANLKTARNALVVAEVALSVVLLIGGFIGVAWVAARIYRVGILMYGKKPSYAELAKWIFYKA